MIEYVKKAPPQPNADTARVRETVTQILSDVRTRGLDAVRHYSRKFDGWDPPSFKVGADEIERARAAVAPDVLASLDFAHAQIGEFAQRQRATLVDLEVETLPGVFLGQRQIPVANVGAYVPGGKYPMLMSAQMTILTAKVAGSTAWWPARRPTRAAASSPRCSGRWRWPAPTRSGAWAACRRSPSWPTAPRATSRSTSSPAPATCTWPKPSGSSSATWASTCWPAPPRSS